MKKIFLFLNLICSMVLSAQTLEHPTIWVKASERAAILDKIDKYDWAQTILQDIESKVSTNLATHQTNPRAILNTVPDFAADDHSQTSSTSASGHYEVLSQASYAGMLYFLTEDEKYAAYAADILAFYSEELSTRTPATTSICGDYFGDPRVTYPQFAIAYDFVYNYLQKPDTKVYDYSSSSRVSFDNSKAQKALKNIASNAIADYLGNPDNYKLNISNHPVLTAPGALFPILCLDDATERERLFNIFWVTGTKRQNSFTKTILPMFGEQGIWPESTSYSFMPNISLILNIVDRNKPELKALENNMPIFNGNFLFSNLRNPDRRFVRYGDSKRNSDATAINYQYALDIAHRKGFDELKTRAEAALNGTYIAKGGYKPELSRSIYENYSALQLFWGHPIPEDSPKIIEYKPTVIIKHAGVALQRNYVQDNNIEYGLCGIIGGAHYVHSHCTGIAMELYGAGYVMAPNGGLPPSTSDRSKPEHVEYFRLYAGNNTVIVNGTSHGRQQGAWSSNSYLWQNTTVNIAAEPSHLQDPISTKFSFATQYLKDDINSCDQQRTLSTIRTSPTTGYYFDMFRSKSRGNNNFHDYIYHNIGDATHLTKNNGDAIVVSATDKYDNDIDDPVKSPGWRFFEDEKSSSPLSEAVKVRFDVNEGNKYMHLLMPAGIDREYTKALSVPTREAKGGYIRKKTQVLAIRQQGEAWEKPYVAIFEPSSQTDASVKSVENLTVGNKIVGAKVTSVVGSTTFQDFIICLDAPAEIELPEHLISFKGRFAVIRRQNQTETTEAVTLYIGEGSTLRYANYTLDAGADKKEVKLFTDVPKDIMFTINTTVLDGGGTIAVHPEKTSYQPAEQVTVTAVPDQGFVFDHWIGDATGSVSTHQLTLNSDLNVTASFKEIIYYTFNITAENGIVSSSVEGNKQEENTQIELTATPNEGYTFTSWTGAINSTKNPLSFNLNSDKNVVANFTVITGLNDTQLQNTFVSPNPCVGQALLTTSRQGECAYTLMDISGRIMQKGVFVGQKALTFEKSGYYFILVETDNSRELLKVIVQE